MCRPLALWGRGWPRVPYRRNVRLHVAGRPIGRQLQDVEGSDINALYAQLLAGDAVRGPLSARSVRYITTILHRAFKDAMKWQAVVRNPVDASDPPRANLEAARHGDLEGS